MTTARIPKTEARKERDARKRHRDVARAHREKVALLVANRAPDTLVDFHRDRAHEATLRSWGWIGPVPRRAPASEATS